ncbi:hypothetical protein NL676_020162 [Syzygium grande]|nr:hypothetical protein NL676_020162 [Syzygium grande]
MLAIEMNKVYILSHHDMLWPLLRWINMTTSKMYRLQTLLFLKDDGTLKPQAIELSLPHPEGDKFVAISKVYTLADHGIESSIWQLAKVHVAVDTHAAIEPFVIATNRQLSVLHPIYKLLHSHFRDAMNINAFSRQILINAGGILESTAFPAKYSMEMSSAFDTQWVFPLQALLKLSCSVSSQVN